MSPTVASLGLDKFTRAERLALVQELLDTIEVDGPGEPSHPIPLSEAMKQELRRRIAEDDENPDAIVPWEQVKAEVRARYLS